MYVSISNLLMFPTHVDLGHMCIQNSLPSQNCMRSDFIYFLDSRALYTSERSKACTLNSRSFCVPVHKILTCVLYKCTMEINVGSPLTYFSDWCVSEVHVRSGLTCVVNSRTFQIHVKLTNDINSRALRIFCLCYYLTYDTSSRVF